MANPQTEHGYTRIANEVLEALARTRIPGEARQVLDFIIRKTYGFHKKQDLISVSQIAKATGLDPRAVVRAKNRLRSMRIITTDKIVRGKVGKMGMNKNHEQWGTPDKNGNKPLTKLSEVPLTKLSYTKDNIKERKIKSAPTAAEAALNDIYLNQKINVYQIINRFKKELRGRGVTMLGPDYRIPDEVIIETCEGFKKTSVERPYPWFLKVLRQELEIWWVGRQDQAHEALKAEPVAVRGGDIQAVREIIEAMMARTKSAEAVGV